MGNKMNGYIIMYVCTTNNDDSYAGLSSDTRLLVKKPRS
jgi:hypothetical protein